MKTDVLLSLKEKDMSLSLMQIKICFVLVLLQKIFITRILFQVSITQYVKYLEKGIMLMFSMHQPRIMDYKSQFFFKYKKCFFFESVFFKRIFLTHLYYLLTTFIRFVWSGVLILPTFLGQFLFTRNSILFCCSLELCPSTYVLKIKN